MTQSHVLILLVAVACLVSAEPTACESCCNLNGVEAASACSLAFKGKPGKCCGLVSGRGYCCPDERSSMCFKCNAGYRCYETSSGRPPSSICDTLGGFPSSSHSGSRHESGRENYLSNNFDTQGNPLVSMVILLLLGASIVSAFSFCARQHRQQPMASMHQQTVQMGAVPMPSAMPAVAVAPGQPIPAGMPCATAYPAMACGQPMGGCYPAQHGYPAQQQGGGYGGGSVAMGAGMGFLGGMMVGDMMADAGHHGGGDYGGGGGYDGGGGGGFDGGGGDFSADM